MRVDLTIVLALFTASIVYISCETKDDSIVNERPSIYESPLSINLPCRTSYYIRFDQSGNAISKVTYSYDDEGRIISIDTDGTLKTYEYDENGHYNFLMNWNDSSFYAINYLADTIMRYSIDSNSGNPYQICLSLLCTNFNTFQKPEYYIHLGGCGVVLEEVNLTYDQNGNLTKESKVFGIARWYERRYNHDFLLRDPFPVPWIYEERSNAILYKTEKYSVPTYETSFEYKANRDFVEINVHETEVINGIVESDTEYKKFEIYFECF